MAECATHFFFREKIIATVNRLVSDADIRHMTDWFVAAFHKYIIGIQEICVDILCNVHLFAGIEPFRLRCVCHAESYNHAMDVRLTVGFAVPPEGTMGKINIVITGAKGTVFPQDANEGVKYASPSVMALRSRHKKSTSGGGAFFFSCRYSAVHVE